jgi:hypothetical protein
VVEDVIEVVVDGAVEVEVVAGGAVVVDDGAGRAGASELDEPVPV